MLYEQELKEIKQKLNANCYKQIRRIEKQLADILQEVIIGNEDVDIAALINSLGTRNWVESGLQFIDVTNGICPFCHQETIDDELKEKFNKYFDVTYKNKINKIQHLKILYEQKTEEFLNNVLQIQNVFNPNNYVSNLYLSLQELFNLNKATIVEKIKTSN